MPSGTFIQEICLGLRLTKEALNINAGGLSIENALNIEDRNQTLCIAQITIDAKNKDK